MWSDPPVPPGDDPRHDPVAQEFHNIADAAEKAGALEAVAEFASGLGRVRLALRMAGFSDDESFVLTRDFAQQALAEHTLQHAFDQAEDHDDPQD